MAWQNSGLGAFCYTGPSELIIGEKSCMYGKQRIQTQMRRYR